MMSTNLQFASVMDRRAFVGAVAAWSISAPLVSGAQNAQAIRRIGVLDAGAPFDQESLEAEYAPLRALGWFVGRNLIVERRNANGSAELLQPMAEELVRLNVEIIITFSTGAALAAKRATTTIPIVMHSAGDPVRTGLVASFTHPGGNVTGFSVVGPEIDAKRLSLMRELLPSLHRVGVLEDSTNPYYRAVRPDLEKNSKSLGIQLVFVEFASANDVDKAVSEAARQGAQAVLIDRGGPYWVSRAAIMAAAKRYALPVTAAHDGFLEPGALLTYGNSLEEQFEREASFVNRILRGAKPADLPIEQPTKFQLGINLRAARTLGIDVPRSLLLQAAEVIQ